MTPEHERKALRPLSAIAEYIEVRPLLRQVRVMFRFLDEVIDEEPYRHFYSELLFAFLRLVNEEFAPAAINLALALTELEDAYPEIDRELADPLLNV
jgi:hypothetical protein